MSATEHRRAGGWRTPGGLLVAGVAGVLVAGVLVAGFLVAGFFCPASAQRIAGSVIDPVSGMPVGDALVIVVNEASDPIASLFTEADGTFSVGVPGKGAYMLGVTRQGYQRAITPQLNLVADTVTVEIFLPPAPIAMDSITVTSVRNTPDAGRLRGLIEVERRRGTLAGRLTRAEIQARGPRSDLIALLTTMNIPGLRARRMALSTGAPETAICVETGRNRSVMQKTGSRLASRTNQLGTTDEDDIAARAGACAMVAVFLDDIHIPDPGEVLSSITPADLEGVEILPPLEALARYGFRAANGALLLWTRGR